MKILSAINNEVITKQISRVYYQRFKEEVEIKDVYYFKALLKEMKNNDYDKIIILEELEPPQTQNESVLDKNMFDVIDRVSDDNDADKIIFIAADRRGKSDKFILQLFNIGVYNILLGKDRTVDNLVNLINAPRSKKDAKQYVSVKPKSGNGEYQGFNGIIDKNELSRILMSFDNAKVSGNPDTYVMIYNRIIDQYTDEQLKYIGNNLAEDVVRVLSKKSKKFRQVMNLSTEELESIEMNSKSSDNKNDSFVEEEIQVPDINLHDIQGLEDNLEDNFEDNFNPGPAILETTPFKTNKEKFKEEPKIEEKVEYEKQEEDVVEVEKEDVVSYEEPTKEIKEEHIYNNEVQQDFTDNIDDSFVEEIQVPDINLRDMQGLEDTFEDKSSPETVIPEATSFESKEEPVTNFDTNQNNSTFIKERDYKNSSYKEASKEMIKEVEVVKQVYDVPKDYKKTVAFIGAHGVGKTFVINVIAECLSRQGIKVAIIDMTLNKSHYYIHAINKDEKRNDAIKSLDMLVRGKNAPVQKGNISIYTGLPNKKPKDDADYINVMDIVESKNSVVLIDCDFETPLDIIKYVDDVYIVQDMNMLGIQPITEYLRQIKHKGVNLKKLKVVINKYIYNSLNPRRIIESLVYYSNPELTIYDELFDENVPYFILPFFIENYKIYIEGLLDCKVEYGKFNEEFKRATEEIASDIYRIVKFKNSGNNKKKFNFFK